MKLLAEIRIPVDRTWKEQRLQLLEPESEREVDYARIVNDLVDLSQGKAGKRVTLRMTLEVAE